MEIVRERESLALLSLREKLIRAVARYEPKEITDLIKDQIETQVVNDAENLLKNQEKIHKATSCSHIPTETKDLIKLNIAALKLFQDFGVMTDDDLRHLLTNIGRRYKTMTMGVDLLQQH